MFYRWCQMTELHKYPQRFGLFYCYGANVYKGIKFGQEKGFAKRKTRCAINLNPLKTTGYSLFAGFYWGCAKHENVIIAWYKRANTGVRVVTPLAVIDGIQRGSFF